MGDLSHVDVLAALANQNRLDILNQLRGGTKNVTELAEATGLNQSTISHSLQRLSISGLITGTQQNRFRYYKISAPVISALLKALEK